MTKEELRQLTKQGFYDLIIQCAKDGTFPSREITRDGSYGCLYRADKTPTCKQRCPAGVLLPDEDYDNISEGTPAGSIPVNKYLILPPGITLQDIISLQSIHDQLSSSDNWNGDIFIRQTNHMFCFGDIKRCEV